jgi:hypothetical protein
MQNDGRGHLWEYSYPHMTPIADDVKGDSEDRVVLPFVREIRQPGEDFQSLLEARGAEVAHRL